MKRLVKKLYNLYRWLPIIWKDEDWDDHYIFEILKFKLTNQAKYIGDRDFHTRAKRDAEIMMTCVKLMEKVQSEYYNLESMNYVDEDYNWILDETYPDLHKLEIKENSNNFKDYFAKYPLIYKIATDPNTPWHYIERCDKTYAMFIGQYNHNRARKLLFKLLERNIECWWD